VGGEITNMGVGEERVAEKPELEDVEENYRNPGGWLA
jgi:hypothetical protein